MFWTPLVLVWVVGSRGRGGPASHVSPFSATFRCESHLPRFKAVHSALPCAMCRHCGQCTREGGGGFPLKLDTDLRPHLGTDFQPVHFPVAWDTQKLCLGYRVQYTGTFFGIHRNA